jgi:putative Mg2+ transporter-C (MgtC) family protein
MLLAAAIGYERESRSSTAGLRTHMLVALGVTVVVSTAGEWATGTTDVARVVQGVLAGIGFLGAGAIIKQREQVKGLTTAASIWATAAIAAVVGLGHALTAILATVLALVILGLLLRLEQRAGGKRNAADARER